MYKMFGTILRKLRKKDSSKETEKQYLYDFKNSHNNKNIIVVGSAGAGKCHHPWDSLRPCKCGCKDSPLLMYENDRLYYCGGSTDAVFAMCPVCGARTEKKDIASVIEDWNDMSSEFSMMEKVNDKLSLNLSREDWNHLDFLLEEVEKNIREEEVLMKDETFFHMLAAVKHDAENFEKIPNCIRMSKIVVKYCLNINPKIIYLKTFVSTLSNMEWYKAYLMDELQKVGCGMSFTGILQECNNYIITDPQKKTWKKL